MSAGTKAVFVTDGPATRYAGVVARAARCTGAIARAALFGLAVAAVSGCEAGPAPTSTSRDSLGVTIVESVAPAWAPDAAWRIDEEPLLDLAETGSGDMHNFFRVRDMLRTGEHLIVADGISQQIRVYDSAGRFLRAFGGPGEGPGEFRTLWTVVSTGDGRFVGMDLTGGGPGAEFDLESGLVSTFRMPQGVQPLRHPVHSEIVWGWDGGYTMDDEGIRQGLQRAVATVVRLSEDRMSSHPVTNVPGREFVVAPNADVIPLMGRITHAVPVGDGTMVIGTADALEYSMIDGRTGETRRIARILGVSLALSKEEVDLERQTRLGPNPRPYIRDLLERLPVPEEKPAYQRMIVDAEGNVWAGEYLGLARREEPQDWYVWDSLGVWLGIVETPARFELMRVGADEVFGVWRDVNDVEHPRVLGLVKLE